MGSIPTPGTKYTTLRLKDKAAAATVNRELAALKRMFRLGMRQGMVATMPHIAMLTETNTRSGSATEFLELTPEEAASVETTLMRNRASRTAQHSQVSLEKALAPSKKGATTKRARNVR